MSQADSEKTDLVLKDSSIFHMLESEDEKQILQEFTGLAGTELVYAVSQWDSKTQKYRTHHEPSYTGVSHLTILLSQNLKQGLEITHFETEIKNTGGLDRWFAKVKYRNIVTGLESLGVAEQTVLLKQKKKDSEGKDVKENGEQVYEYVKYDDFGERKAVSKAKRNAMKDQFPAKLILEFIKLCQDKGQVKSMEPAQVTELCTCEPKVRKPNEKENAKGRLTCNNCAKTISEIASRAIINKRNRESESSS